MGMVVISFNKMDFANKADFVKPNHTYNKCHVPTINCLGEP